MLQVPVHLYIACTFSYSVWVVYHIAPAHGDLCNLNPVHASPCSQSPVASLHLNPSSYLDLHLLLSLHWQMLCTCGLSKEHRSFVVQHPICAGINRSERSCISSEQRPGCKGHLRTWHNVASNQVAPARGRRSGTQVQGLKGGGWTGQRSHQLTLNRGRALMRIKKQATTAGCRQSVAPSDQHNC